MLKMTKRKGMGSSLVDLPKASRLLPRLEPPRGTIETVQNKIDCLKALNMLRERSQPLAEAITTTR